MEAKKEYKTDYCIENKDGRTWKQIRYPKGSSYYGRKKDTEKVGFRKKKSKGGGRKENKNKTIHNGQYNNLKEMI